jgi:hypothetical protein
MHTLRLSAEIRMRLGRVERASALYPNEDDGIEPLNEEKVALADAVVRAVDAQRLARAIRLQQVPRPRVIPVVVDLRLVRRRQRGA